MRLAGFARSAVSHKVRPLAVALGLGAMMACAPSDNEILSLATRDGRTVSDLVSEEPTVLLIYAASTCFGCGTPLEDWEDLARAGRLRMLVLLHGKVSEADLRNLRIQRVPAVPLSEKAVERFKVPSEIVLINGRVVMKSHGSKQLLRRRLWQVVAADSTRFPVGSHHNLIVPTPTTEGPR